MRPVVYPVGFSIVWHVYFLCTLHCQDITTYADALRSELSMDIPGAGFLETMTEIEDRIAARLRHASKTWVPYVVFVVSCGCLYTLGGISFVLYSKGFEGVFKRMV